MLRLKFRQILEDGKFQSYDGIHAPVDPITTVVPVEWGFKWNDKPDELYSEFKSNVSNKDAPKTYIN